MRANGAGILGNVSRKQRYAVADPPAQPRRPDSDRSDPPDLDSDRSDAADRLNVDLERDGFLRSLLRELSGSLQEVIGVEEASGFVSVVGRRMGRDLDRSYRAALGVEKLTREQVADVLVDLKRRIQGDFYIIEEDEEKLVLGNRACPFGDRVKDRPSLCMMTSNVFGSITAENLGYARVDVAEAIARGDSECRIVIYLKPTGAERTGREYFRTPLTPLKFPE